MVPKPRMLEDSSAAKLCSMGYPAVHMNGRGPAGNAGYQFRLV